jgi:hypothetical protein
MPHDKTLAIVLEKQKMITKILTLLFLVTLNFCFGQTVVNSPIVKNNLPIHKKDSTTSTVDNDSTKGVLDNNDFNTTEKMNEFLNSATA